MKKYGAKKSGWRNIKKQNEKKYGYVVSDKTKKNLLDMIDASDYEEQEHPVANSLFRVCF